MTVSNSDESKVKIKTFDDYWKESEFEIFKLELLNYYEVLTKKSYLNVGKMAKQLVGLKYLALKIGFQE